MRTQTRESASAAHVWPVSAMFSIVFLMNGPAVGGPWDSFSAEPLLSARAYLGNPSAQNTLGRLYFRGAGVKQDDDEAVVWWTRAAVQGNADAQANLGAMFDQGRGVPRDNEQASTWWTKAAAQGNLAAQVNLLALSDTGRGLPEDDRDAVIWYRKLARTGDPLIQYMLGRRYEIGRGVADDKVRAFAWFVIAAENESKDAMEKISEMEVSLTDGQRQEARSWAVRCQLSNFDGCD